MFLLRLFREMLQKAEEGARSKIRRWRDGTYRSVSFIDTVGHTEALTRVSLIMEKRGEEIHFDLTGTSPENDGSLQAFAHATWACAATYLFSFAFHDLPPCIGAYESIVFHVPEGTLLNPGPDAAVANAPHIGQVDCAATAAQRRRERDWRLKRGVSFSEFEETWSRKRPPDSALRYFGRWPDGVPQGEVRRG